MRDFPVKIKMPNRRSYMTAKELANWANKVNCRVGGKAVFSENDFPERLKGDHCACGMDDDGYTKGVFTLCALTSEAVKDGEKAYMICDVCGCYSHL